MKEGSQISFNQNIDTQFINVDTENQPSSKFFIDDWELPSGYILAPMAGISDSPFRRLCRKFGAGLLYTECISAEGIRRLGEKSFELVKFREEERPIAVQLFGKEPQQFADAASIIKDRYSPDMIDVNCGCPVKKFVTRSCGGWLMQHPDLIGRIVEAIKEATGLPVSVKLRTGYREPVETASETAIVAEEAGASLVAIHGRWVRKAKGSSADWEAIRRVKDAVKEVPVVGNGDVWSQADAERMLNETRCDRVMIARGIGGKPWLFSRKENKSEVDEPNFCERIDIMLMHYRLIMEDFHEKAGIHRMRKHFGWYTHGMPGSAKLRGEVMKLETLDEVTGLISDYRNEVLEKHDAQL